MADKTTGGLTAVRETAIGDLPSIAGLYDDTLIPVEQQGEARKMNGAQWKEYARAAVDQDVGFAESFATSAAVSAAAAAGSAGQANQYAQMANTARSGAEAARDAAEAAKDGAQSAAADANLDAASASSKALLSQSWAEGGTGAREGEDSDNSKYWANQAQAYAEQASNPVVVQGVYNYILEDRQTGDRYALLVEGGTLKLLGVPNTMDATDMALIDTVTGLKQQLIVESGTLKLLEVE